MTNVNQAPLPRCQKRRWYVLRLLSGAISSTWLYLLPFYIGYSLRRSAATAQREGVARLSRRDFLNFFWPCDLDLWPFDSIGERGIVMDYPHAKFSDFIFNRFGFIVRSDRRTDRQTDRHTDRQSHRITDADDSVSNNNNNRPTYSKQHF